MCYHFHSTHRHRMDEIICCCSLPLDRTIKKSIRDRRENTTLLRSIFFASETCFLVFLLRWFLFDYVSASQFLDSPKIFDYFWRRNGDAAAWAWSWIRKIWTIWSKHYKLLLILNTDETMTWNCKKCLKHFLVSTNLVSIRSLLSNTNIVESFQHFRILNLNYSEKKISSKNVFAVKWKVLTRVYMEWNGN